MKLRSTIPKTITSFFAALTLLAPATAAAQGLPTLYFEKSTLSAASGSNVDLTVHVNGNGTAVNTVNVVVTFSDDQLSFVGLDKTGSYFDTVVPSAPKAKNGKLEFAVASLGHATSDDVVVTHVLFKAMGTSGSTKVSLAGSQTANGGPAIDTATSDATVNLSAGSGSSSDLNLTAITVDNITSSTAVVKWHTDVPATSSVDYGNTDTYGFSASAPGLTTDHSVSLGESFGGKTLVHFKVMSTSEDNKVGISKDHTFTTLGYTVKITLKDKQGNIYSGATVRIGDSSAVKTDASGVAVIKNVASGNQKVYIGDLTAQIITVKTVNGQQANVPQEFSVVAARSSAAAQTALLAFLFVVLAAVLLWAWRKRGIQPTA